MEKEQYLSEKHYQIARGIMLRLLDEKLITKQEFAGIDAKLQKKYRPIIGKLLS